MHDSRCIPRPWDVLSGGSSFYKIILRTPAVSFGEFRVDTHLRKLRCWYSVVYYVGEFFRLMGGVLLFIFLFFSYEQCLILRSFIFLHNQFLG